jgi:predicted DNA-binding protein
MTDRDLDHMSKDEAVAWFNTADSLSPAIRSMTPATEPPPNPAPDMPMMLASIRLPLPLIERLDAIANQQGTRRSDVIREALTRYVAEQTTPVSRDEAEHALDVLRRIVASRTTGTARPPEPAPTPARSNLNLRI